MQPETTSPSLLEQGLAFHSAGQLAEAEEAYRGALKENLANADAHQLLGLLAFQTSRPELAVEELGKAVELQPQVASYRGNLALVLDKLGRRQEAESHYRKTLELQQDNVETHYNLANLLRDDERMAEAEEHYRAALALRPDYFEACYTLGLMLQAMKRYPDAEAQLKRAITLKPSHAGAHNNLGNLYFAMDRLKEAEQCYLKALSFGGEDARLYHNLGNLMHLTVRPKEAEVNLRKALALSPDDPVMHVMLAFELLSQGQWEEGWREYEWGPRAKKFASPVNDTKPLWRGEGIGERTLLLYSDHGLGDCIQFSRYVSLAAKRARVVLKAPLALKALFETLPGISGVITDENGEAFDAWCPLMSLPFIFNTRMDTVPPAPYLKASTFRTAYWKEKLARVAGRKIGLVWAGNPILPTDARRSIAPELFEPLSAIPGVSFISLQKGATSKPSFIAHDWTGELSDMAETAALIENLDLVISVDTAVVHLTGAIGKPVWMLNRFDSDWRWLRGRDDSPWYPTLRQFRQKAPGEWGEVMSRVVAALREA